MSRIVLNGLRLAMVVLIALSGVVARDARADVRLVGNVYYNKLDPTTVVLQADRIENDNWFLASGVLRLELWAFRAPYNGTSQLGLQLAIHDLRALAAGSALTNFSSGSIPYTQAGVGTWYFAMFLSEYDGHSYAKRSWGNFPNPVVIGHLSIPRSLTFPAQPAGTSSAPQTVVVTNTGPGTVTISNVTGFNSVDFFHSTTCIGRVMAPSATCNVTVTFTPRAAQSWEGDIGFLSDGDLAEQYIHLFGTGTAAVPPGQLALASTLQFGNQTVGISRTQNVTITNTGGQAVTTSSVTVSGADFSGIPTGCATIAAGASCNVAVTFAPSATGNRIGTLNVVSNGVGSPQTMQLSGVGSAAVGPGQLLISGPLSFGNQTVGTSSAPKAINISNIGGQTVTTTSRTISGTDFSASQTGCLFIAAGSSCTVFVTFSPSGAGNRTGTLNIASDGVGSPQSVQLSGVGVTTAPPPSTTATAIEYYHAAFDHYFVTAIADEITKLDNGTFQGWARTGWTFNVYTSTQSGLAAVCRFFSTTFAPKSSHFYTPDAPECSTVQANPNWQFEAVVFYMAKADANGICPALTQPVYRLYNNGQGAAPNHRYTTNTTVRTQMLGQGWIPEGYGPAGVIMCAPL